MPNFIDLTGKRFGRLVVIAYARDAKWFCICDCGTHRVVHGRSLRRGLTKSCGCLHREFRLIDLSGKRFGRWTVRAYAGGSKWSCVCDCGTRGFVDGAELRRGQSKSCGCLSRELVKARSTKHGMSGTPEYKSWSAMMARCLNPRHPHYENYGGRGIAPCERWANSVQELFADMGERPPGCSLDRIDPDGNYEPGNCRWADRKQQRQNRRPSKQRKRRRSNLADIQAYAESLARAGARAGARP